VKTTTTTTTTTTAVIGTNLCFRTEKDYKQFSVTPEIGTLAVNDNMQVHVEFNPQQTGSHNGHLVVNYDTGQFRISDLIHLNICSTHLIKESSSLLLFFVSVA
jgi:hypothetical protein